MSRNPCSPHKTAGILPVCLCVCSGMWSFWMSRNVYTKGWASPLHLGTLHDVFVQMISLACRQPNYLSSSVSSETHIDGPVVCYVWVSECHSAQPLCHGSYYSAAQCSSLVRLGVSSCRHRYFNTPHAHLGFSSVFCCGNFNFNPLTE